ncbi:type II toxin-antitoxin system PemK/MazF family toxin [uncultured Solobacterium sp.]|uniref:type II toxin-antitoxin system PemK/MazF family toxin n=1 Tax=uncultured Solobacterium sp. TaxID=747375 RepID=UPI0028E81753|nr:type II toxin-antitoxin system PemK/MazF family toxin [uncultured Solobacterium sp.]
MKDKAQKYDLWHHYMSYRKDLYRIIQPHNIEAGMISEANWVIRSRYQSGKDIGINVKPGDICYIEFGQSYLNEMGYQHFGLVVSVCAKKALVVPMTSNEATYQKAYDSIYHPQGKYHLMKIGLVNGLNKPSVLFLNDIRFINTARVIDIKAHIPVTAPMFKEVQKRMLRVMFSTE